MQKKVSVIIPFYSHVEWLCEAVQSVLDQTYKNFEIIVVNDGSKENVDDFLKEYGNKIIYRYKENGGAATARNLGMELATGEYFAFLDSDDIWLPAKTEKQIAFMEEIGAMWSHTGFYHWKPQTNKLKQIKNNDDYGYMYKKIFVSVHIATPSVIVNRQALQEHPEIIFPVEFRTGQDVRFFHELSKYYQLALIQEPLVKVRLHGSNKYAHVLPRFNSRAKRYIEERDDPMIPKGIKRIWFIYYIYSKIFGTRTNRTKEFMAKLFLIFPYSIERIYTKRIIKEMDKNPKYLHF